MGTLRTGLLALVSMAALSPAGFPASPNCATCHRAIVERYLQTPMANSSGTVRPAAEQPGEFEHAASRTRYRIEAENGALQLRWPGGKVNLELFIGSRRMGRSFAWSEDGYFYQAPVGYYAARHAWDMAPGYERDRRPDLDRPIKRECLFCHASGVRFAPGTVNRILNAEEVRGVACERCHGDGAAHAREPRRDNIVNPARLPAGLRDSVCEQCHLGGAASVALAGRKLADFRPGQELSSYLAVFLARNGLGGVSVNGHAEALSRSRCRQASADLWCGTCHSPHAATASFRDKCLGCHQARQCPSPGRDSKDCTECHMPKARAFDGGHTVYTDHSIPRRPPGRRPQPEPPESLIAYYSQPAGPRESGLAYAQVAEKYGNAGFYEKAWPLLRQAAVAGARDPAVESELAFLLDRAGRVEQAEALYRSVLAAEPDNLMALANLGDLLFRRGKKTDAFALWKRALEANPRQPGLREALATR